MGHFRAFLLASIVQLTSANASFWGNRLVEELEHLLVDHEGYNDGNFTFGITPCGFYFQGPQTTGRDTAGQWMRVGFHDFATANIAKGTGGMDASIGWETNRPENSGTAMNDSLSFFNPFVNEHASMADMIALGTTLAVKVCGGPRISFKGGRVDAPGPGDFGVPEPDTDITTTLDRFALAGFTQTEAIQLTACGHTVGRVHHAGFPTVVGPEPVSANNTQGGVDMDDTFNVYDNHVVTGYLDDSTTNPLVKSFNVSSRSDLRIFSSDLNNTMKDLATSNDHFKETCATVVAKQLNTVPASVNLQNITPIPVKPTNVELSLDESGHVRMTGDIRLLGNDFPVNQNRSVYINYYHRDGSFGGSIQASPVTPATTGSSQYTDSTNYFHPFVVTVPDTKGLGGFSISVEENSHSRVTFDNGGKKFNVEDKVFWMKSLTTTSISGSTATVTIIAAVLNAFHASNVNAIFRVPTPQIGTLTPLVMPFNISLSENTSESPTTLYSFYSGSFSTSSLNNTATGTTMDIVAHSRNGAIAVDDFRKLGSLTWT